MKASEVSINGESETKREKKPPFRPAKDDTKPLLQDPVISLSLSLSLSPYIHKYIVYVYVCVLCIYVRSVYLMVTFIIFALISGKLV